MGGQDGAGAGGLTRGQALAPGTRERKLLVENPLAALKKVKVSSSDRVDPRVLVNKTQAAQLLAAVSYVGTWDRKKGRRLVAFYAVTFWMPRPPRTWRFPARPVRTWLYRRDAVHTAVDLLEGKGFNLATLVVAALALVMGTLAVYYGRKALFPPKRQLTYLMERSSPILDRSALDPGNNAIEVRRNGVPLIDPHLVVVWAKNTGRHAIASEQFDQGRPLELDLQAPIVELITAEVGGSQSVMSACAISGKSVLFGPELLKRRQAVTFTVLTEGNADLVVREHFIDVKMKDAGHLSRQERFFRAMAEPAGVGALAATAAMLATLIS
ncbi:hypothetical protein [Streptomyces sp. NPDC058613]|uniref:hypothetical protein n=1 Tax=Streptomyces sp. NPDC058613 TaxID=3346556 RepID=UPI00365BEDA3